MTTELNKVLHNKEIHIAVLLETILPEKEFSMPMATLPINVHVKSARVS